MKTLPYPMFEAMCEAHHLPVPLREHRFHKSRKWRFDFAWPDEFCGSGVALEVDGGVFVRGRHSRGAGIIKDQEKLNEAEVAGWVVLRCVPSDIKSGKVFELLSRVLARDEFD